MSATTLEFYRSGGTVKVICNLQKMSLQEFLAMEGSRTVLVKICKAVHQQYPAECPCSEQSCMRQSGGEYRIHCEAAAIVGAFIRKHFLGEERRFDVVVSDDSDFVQLNLE